MRDEESSIENLEILPEHESGVRRMASDAHGIPYHSLHSLEEAISFPDGIVILEGDDSGQIYVVSPASMVKCSDEALNHLLRDLDSIAWPHNDPNSARIYYERRPVGSQVFGGMGGASVIKGVWIHQMFIDAGLGNQIQEVIEGRRARVRDAA
jgi:hypothetical protein